MAGQGVGGGFPGMGMPPGMSMEQLQQFMQARAYPTSFGLAHASSSPFSRVLLHPGVGKWQHVALLLQFRT